MSRIESILVPIDFESPSERALAYAVELGEKLGASVHVMTAYDLPTSSLPEGVLLASVETVARLMEAAQAALDRACAPYREAKVPVTSHVEKGDPRDAILAVARDRHVSLIVMGTHGRKGIARALIGSTAESIIRSSEIPVLTVH